MTALRHESSVQQSTRSQSRLILVSRASGLVRLVVAFLVLGTGSALGNVYSSANAIPTIIFEFLAAGALTAALVPRIQRLRSDNDDDGLRRLVSTVLTWGGAILACVLILVVLFREHIADQLLGEMANSADRAAAKRLLVMLLLIFLPQLPAYLVNAVSIGYLHAQRRFSTSVACPIINNFILIAVYGVFAWELRGGSPSVGLSTTQMLTLGIGTTAGVVAMCAVPFIDAVTHGMRFGRPVSPIDPFVRTLATEGSWATMFLAGGQMVTAAALPLVNAHNGDGLVWTVVWQIFLLPYALMAVPVTNARYPELVACARSGDERQFQDLLTAGVRSVFTTGAVAGTAIWAVSKPLSAAVSVGPASSAGPSMQAGLSWIGVGIGAYGLFNLLARACYAHLDQRTPGIVSVASAGVGIASMYTIDSLSDSPSRIAAVAIGACVAPIVGACSLWVWLLRQRRAPLFEGGLLVQRAVLAISICAVCRLMVDALGDQPALLSVLTAGITGIVVLSVWAVGDRRISGASTSETLASFGVAVGPTRMRQDRR